MVKFNLTQLLLSICSFQNNFSATKYTKKQTIKIKRNNKIFSRIL